MTRYDVIVVGGGIVAGAVTHQLALTSRRRVLAVEQARIAGSGATPRSGSLVRQHHTAHCGIPLAVASLRRFREWAGLVGGECGFRRTGFAMIAGARYAGPLGRNVDAVNEAGGRARRIDAGELAALHPGLAVEPDAAVGYEPDSGYADPVLATHALFAAACGLGAKLAQGAQVTAVTTAGDRVTGVRTNLGDITAGTVVLCAGAGSEPLLAPFSPTALLQPRRIGVAEAELAVPAPGLPCAIDDITATYFRPLPGTGVLFGVRTDPAAPPGCEPCPVRLTEAAEAAARLSAHLPGLRTAPVTGSRVGVDGYTPDRQPLIGPFGPAGLYLCTGFSGGGAKMAPEVGALVATELASGEPARPLLPFRPSRFATGDPIESDFPYGNS